MTMDPDIQKHFDFKYVEGELHMFISKELVKALGWTDKDIELSFGNIKKMIVLMVLVSQFPQTIIMNTHGTNTRRTRVKSNSEIL